MSEGNKNSSVKTSIGPRIEKVTINIGVGEAGERLKKAESVLKNITGHKPIQTLSKITSKEWGIRKRMPIGCKVTLRKKDANSFLTAALKTRENRIADYAFDSEGNLSFGIPDLRRTLLSCIVSTIKQPAFLQIRRIVISSSVLLRGEEIL